MILNKIKSIKASFLFALIILLIGTFSCDDDIREVTLFEKGSIDIVPSTMNVEYGGTIDFTSNAVKAQSITWTFEGGNPATSSDENVSVNYTQGTGEFETTYNVKLDVKYIDNQTESKTITIVVAADPNYTPPITGGGGGTPIGPLKIAIATNNVDNEAGYIAALVAAGHTVEAISKKYENLTADGVTTLNSFDLVIISRNNSSGSYGTDSNVRANWMSVTTPIIIMSPYVARTSRLQLFSSDGGNDGGGASVNAIIETHPVFTGINLTNGNTGVITTSTLNTPDTAGVGNGKLIGNDGNNVAIAEWDAKTAAYTGAGVHAGKRMYLAATGTYTFNDVGTKLFLNCVEYIVSGGVYNGGGSSGPVDGLGFYTERVTSTVLGAEKPASNSGNFKISYVADAAEGSEAIYANYTKTGSGNDVTWGAMLSMYPSDGANRVTLNISAYNYWNISLKAPAENTDALRLRLRTAGGNYWVVIKSQYGFIRDGKWHDLKIPLSDLLKDGNGSALDADKSGITEVIFRSDVDAATLGSNFDWYIDDIYFSN